MTDILFYHLTESRLTDALPPLIEKSLERGWRVAVQMADTAARDAFDAHLWTFRDDSFVPHGTDANEFAEKQPVLLLTGDENPNTATVRFCVEGVPAPDPSAYERLVLMFDGHDQAQLEAARAEWKRLKADGHKLTYWQQTPEGRWEKKA
ncbi:DNA polymerase III subunit chi [Rhizobium sp. RU36D]|uniref:DNA polymerase III subunit chi n=1 Tax=Rhizobium sp. RU36D TaxID=1907415 RepID=UPI0009D9131A|nr:DNA polymerase III subunit chi [Rhizobium sp. RU36D]SMD06908.1 DNA polymerase III, chi subunit [Rhizobium sp. RU36D]